jgi:hypothetical protein
MPDDVELDGCDIDFAEEALTEEEQELFPLFAEALDPDSPVTVEDVEREWGVR